MCIHSLFFLLLIPFTPKSDLQFKISQVQGLSWSRLSAQSPVSGPSCFRKVAVNKLEAQYFPSTVASKLCQ